jgi:Cysteine rich repeat
VYASSVCLQEVKRFVRGMSRDYRLNRHLYVDCEEDIPALCADVCDAYAGEACGGAVLRCLTENKARIKKSACKKEVFYFLKMEVRA